MLTILNDPAGITGRRRIEWQLGRTVFEHIAEAMPEGGSDCSVRFNGCDVVDPVCDERMSAPPLSGDEVVVINRPDGVETWVLIASVLLAAYSYSLIPKPVDQPQQSQSPNNRLTGQTNIARAYQAIEDVYGYRRVWPSLIQPSLSEYVNHVAYVTEWLCVSRGKGTLTDVQYAETPIDDVAGATHDVFAPAASPSPYPELNDTTITDVREPFQCEDVNGQELQPESPAVITDFAGLQTTAGSAQFVFRINDGAHLDYLKSIAGSGTAFVQYDAAGINELCVVDYYFIDDGNIAQFTFVASAPFGASADFNDYIFITPTGGPEAQGPFTLPVAADRIQWNMVFPRGLVGEVQVRVEWWKVDGNDAEIGGTRDDDVFTYSANTYDARAFTDVVTPAAGQGRYQVTFKRLTADLGNGADVAKLETLYAIRYYATKVLPGVTVIRVVTKATPQATGFKDRKFNARWVRHVRTLTGTAVSESRNFARAFVHLWAISGNSVSELATSDMQAINTALGDDSPLLRFDWSFDDANLSIGERLQAIANVARCVLWRDGTQWTISRDQAKPRPELQLDYRNLASSGDSGISYDAVMPASFDGVEVEFVEEDDQQRKDYIRLDISSGSVVSGSSANPKKIKLIGCATTAQALNRAHIEARKLLYQRESVQDTALGDAGSLGPTAMVRWVDPHDFYADDGMQSGEVVAIDGSVITTSEPLQWGAETSGRMIFTGVDGAPLGAAVLVTPAGVKGALLASVPGGLYVRDDTRQLGSRFAFGAGLSAAEIESAGLYTFVSGRPASDRTVAVSLVNYDARIYEMDFLLVLGAALEIDTALPVASNIRALATARELDTAGAIGTTYRSTIGVAQEADSAQALIAFSTFTAFEADSALAIT